MCLISRFLNKTTKDNTTGCLNWTGAKSHSGYGIFWKNGRHESSHRASYSLFKGPIPEGLIVMHTCDNPICVNPSHLISGTLSDNSKDRDAKRRGHTVKLSEADVKYIRESYEKGEVTMVELGRKFGVHHSTISRCVRNKYWS